MISHKHKCIFVHLRRTAGNSIEEALGSIQLFDRSGKPTNQWDNKLHRGNTRYKHDKRGHYLHTTATEIRDLYPDSFDKYFKFSIVRNPWDQMISYYFRVTPKDHEGRKFKAWLKKFNTLKGTTPRSSLYDERGRCMMDYIGKFENLESDFSTVCKHIDLKDAHLMHQNPSKRSSYQGYYDDETRAIVEALFEKDISEFGYRF